MSWVSWRSAVVRRVVVAAAFAVGAGVVVGQSPAPEAKPAADLKPAQEKTRELFRKLQRELLTLSQKLAASDRPEDKERAKVIAAALELSRKENIEGLFQKMVEGLAAGAKPGDLDGLAGQDAQLVKVLEEMLRVLMTDDAATQAKLERERLEKLLAEARAALREQQQVRAQTEAQKADLKKLEDGQKKVTDRTKELAKRMADAKDAKDNPKKNEPKDGKGEPKDGKGEPKDGKGEPKDGKGEPKKGDDAKGEPKGSESKDADAKNNGPSPPGKKDVQDAVKAQQKAEQELKNKDKDDATKSQDKAIEKLAAAVKEMEKRLKQLREEEELKLLANIEARIAKMLAMQTAVYEATKAIDAVVTKAAGVKSPADVQKAQQQGDRETEILAEAEKALKLMESEGSAVAFARILDEVRVDMVAVQKRLSDTYVGRDTQAVEENIIAMLGEMRAALKRAIDDKQQPPPPPGPPPPGGQPQPQSLIDQIAELKLIKSMQLQVNGRTKVEAQKYKGETASDPIVRAELEQLARRQAKLQEMIQKIATGGNQ